MDRTARLTRGIVAGLVAGGAVAVWFLLVDASRGVPFRTPAFIASALLGRQAIDMSVGLVLLYTLIHFGLFALVGMGAAWLVGRLPVSPGTLLGLVLGFLLFDLVFYTSVTVTGVDVVAELGWPEVLIGNLLAGVALMKFLQLTGATKPMSWWESLERHTIVREGLIAGLTGASVVAAWFLVFDVVRGQPFFTPGALGSALFLGASNASQVEVNFMTVGAYTVFHLLSFGVVGIVAAAIVCEAEENPPLLLGGMILFVAFEALFLGVLALVAEFLLGANAWWTIAVGNLLAALAMGYYLWRAHPKLRGAVRSDTFFEETTYAAERVG